MPNPEEYRRTRRIVELLMLITRQPRRWTRRALAERYELSEKQMDKDVLLLRHGLRMPLRHSPDGYYFDGPVVLPTLTLTLPEALSLLLAARLGYTMPGVPRGDLAAAIARVEALLPDELLPLVGGLDRGGPEDRAPAGPLRELQMAIAERAQLRIVYRSASHPTDSEQQSAIGYPPSVGRSVPNPELRTQNSEPRTQNSEPPSGLSAQDSGPGVRTVDPYTLIPHERSWYLIAHCHLRGEVRTFKVSRIDRIERTGEEFVFPRDFDLTDYMGHTWGLLRGEAGAR
ncbi:MAG: WYL domain-containing protein, partial [Actinobacteria bacterium]|nr:WYL domain-containing protein [Actinomycetota bacterium]